MLNEGTKSKRIRLADGDHVPRRVRLTSGRASNKVSTTRFQWVNGLAKAWRAGCESYYNENFTVTKR